MINAYERTGGESGASVASDAGGGLGLSGQRRKVMALRSGAGGSLERMISAQRRPAGRRYERVMFTRLEMEWLAPHPPLDLLDAKYIWVPTGEDNTGVNDRHWLANRADAEGVFRRWDALVSRPHRSGRASFITLGVRRRVCDDPNLNADPKSKNVTSSNSPNPNLSPTGERRLPRYLLRHLGSAPRIHVIGDIQQAPPAV